MSPSDVKSGGDLVPAGTSSLALISSGLVRRGLDLIRESEATAKRIGVLFANTDDSFVSIMIKEIEQEFGSQFDLRFQSAYEIDKIIDFARNGHVDVFVPMVNNMITPHRDMPSRIKIDKTWPERIGPIITFIGHLKRRYGVKVIATCGFPVKEQALQVGADYYFDYLLFGSKDVLLGFKSCFEAISSHHILTAKEQSISVVVDVKLDPAFCRLFEDFGFKVFWACARLEELEELIKDEQIDVAINYQYGPDDFLLRDLVWKYDSTVPVFVTLNWDGNLPPQYETLGLAGYLNFPITPAELREKIYAILPPAKKSIFRSLPIWTQK
jgi:hypothetical protein